MQSINTHSKLRFNGKYRAQVTEVDLDGGRYGAVRVFIPDLMIEGIEPNFGSENYGIYAYPANSSCGGYNSENSDSNYESFVSVPLKGSYVRVFFEEGDPAQCFYESGHNFKHAELPSECTSVAEPHRVKIWKMQSGRSLVICDSPDQARVELTGKRSQMSGSGSGSGGEYSIVGNMNSILIDERPGSEKIMIGSRMGDYINMDIVSGVINMFSRSAIRIETPGVISLVAGAGIQLGASSGGGSVNMSISGDFHLQSRNTFFTQEQEFNVLSGGNNNIDGANTHIQEGRSRTAAPSSPVPPIGSR